jgi:mannose-6-phosphate isomerase-like protein (cupin superfamily)
MPRRRMLQPMEVAAKAPNYADVAVLPADVDPQITVSHNAVDQPFFLAFEEDTVLALMSGSSTVHLRDSNVLRYPLTQGDHVYMPGGTPHRIEVKDEGVLLRYVTNEPAIRAAIFACAECDGEVYRLEWRQDQSDDAVAIYAEVASRFNAEEVRRTCRTCGTVADDVPLERLGWLRDVS